MPSTGATHRYHPPVPSTGTTHRCHPPVPSTGTTHHRCHPTGATHRCHPTGTTHRYPPPVPSTANPGITQRGLIYKGRKAASPVPPTGPAMPVLSRAFSRVSWNPWHWPWETCTPHVLPNGIVGQKRSHSSDSTLWRQTNRLETKLELRACALPGRRSRRGQVAPIILVSPQQCGDVNTDRSALCLGSLPSIADITGTLAHSDSDSGEADHCFHCGSTSDQNADHPFEFCTRRLIKELPAWLIADISARFANCSYSL